MNRCAHRSIESVQDIFVAADVPLDLPAVFVLRVCQIDVEALDIELLMYHSLKTLLSPAYEDRKFEVVLDCTSFTSTSEIPAQWLTTCSQLIPIDIRRRFLTSYILNPNSLTQKYLRRMYNISSGTMLSSGVRACSSVAELLQYVPQESLTALRYPTSLEEEAIIGYTEVTMRQAHEMRMPVTMEVADTHVRVTSIRAAVISPNLNCKSTEIISLADVSDVYNVSTGLDPYEFIIRRSKQGVTSYFSSPQRDSIVKSIRTAKSQLRDTRYFRMDRFPRFSNISATLLHVGMLNIDSEDEGLRGAAYDLLGALCSYLNYDKNPIIVSKAGIIPGDISTFVIGLSDRLASFAPKLTLDFISVISASMDKATAAQRITCLQYMSPWVKNLAKFCNPTSSLYEHSGARLRDCIRSLIDLTISDLEINSMIHKHIWVEIGRQESILVYIVLEELIRAASDGGIGSRRCETIARSTAALSSINVRGRIFSKLRKALGKTSLKPSKTLPENVHWNEIATLARFALVASNHSKQAAYDQLYIPDVFHVVTLIAGTGQTLVRKSLYGVIMNFLQSVYLMRAEDASAPELRLLIDEFIKVENLTLFGLTRQSCTSEYCNYDPPSDKAMIDSQESLTRLLVRVMEVTSGSRGLLNIWRARWMSLATSTAFQLPAATQSRAFLVLGTLATSDVDDDLVYQMLVAFKNALGQSTESDTMAVVCMLRCICKVVPSLTEGSRYLCQIFWLAVALLQSSYTAFYSDAAELMRATVETLEKHGAFEGSSIPNVLLDGRVSLEDTVCQLDHLLCLSFESSFSFTLAAIIFKGVRHNHLRSSAELVLRSLLSVTARCNNQTEDGSASGLCPDALGYFIALLPFCTTHEAYVQLLQDCKGEEFLPAPNSCHSRLVPRVSIELLSLTDSTSALLTVSFASTLLTTAQGDDAETEILYNLLADIGVTRPESVSIIYDILQDRIKDAFANSSNAAIIKAVTIIFRNAQDSLRLGSIHSMSVSTLSTVDEGNPAQSLKQKLEELGMDGLTTSFQFLAPNRSHWSKIAAWISDLVLKIVGLE
jgi:neurofibromin 1